MRSRSARPETSRRGEFRRHATRVEGRWRREPRALGGHAGAIYAVAISADGRRAVSASSDLTVRSWDLDRGESHELSELVTPGVSPLAMSATGRLVAWLSQDGIVHVWDVDTGESWEARVDPGGVSAVAISVDGHRVESGSGNGKLWVWDVKSGQTRLLGYHRDSILSVAMSADGRRAVSGSCDTTIEIWALHSGRLIELHGHTGDVCAVTMSADGRRAVSRPSGGLRVWDLEERRRQGSGQPGQPQSPEGHCLWRWGRMRGTSYPRV